LRRSNVTLGRIAGDPTLERLLREWQTDAVISQWRFDKPDPALGRRGAERSQGKAGKSAGRPKKNTRSVGPRPLGRPKCAAGGGAAASAAPIRRGIAAAVTAQQQHDLAAKKDDSVCGLVRTNVLAAAATTHSYVMRPEREAGDRYEPSPLEMRDDRLQPPLEEQVEVLTDDLMLMSSKLGVEFMERVLNHQAGCKCPVRFCGIPEGRGGQATMVWECRGCKLKLEQKMLPKFKAAITGRYRELLPTLIARASHDAAISQESAMLFMEALGISNLPKSQGHIYQLNKEVNEVQIELAHQHCADNLEIEKAQSRADANYGGDVDGKAGVGVSLDGAYGVQSLGMNKARASEVFVSFIGHKTKSPVAFTFRSSTCRTCSFWRDHRPGEEVPDHACTVNLKGSIVHGERLASGDGVDALMAQGAAPVTVTTDGDSKNLAECQSRVTHDITGLLDVGHGTKNLKSHLLDLKKELGLNRIWTDHQINACLVNVLCALGDARAAESPELAYRRILTLSQHHFLIKDAACAGGIDCSKVHGECDPAWCSMRRKLDAGIAFGDIIETPGDLPYPVITQDQADRVKVVLRKQCSLVACGKMCHLTDTQNNENLNCSVTRAASKKTCMSMSTSYQAAAADGVLEKGRHKVIWRGMAAEALGLQVSALTKERQQVRANRKRAAAAHSAAPAQRARRKVIKVANKDRKAAMTQAGGYRPSSINNDGTDRAAAQARKKKAPTAKAPQCPNCAAGKFHTASRCPVPAGHRQH
jgi:hypothetical protein